MKTNDRFITNFTDSSFQSAFRRYFAELGVSVKDWDGLFREINQEGGNKAYVRVSEDGAVVGFILFTTITLSSWFFEAPMGFVREFWIAEAYRGCGHGSALLQLTEDYFTSHHLHKSILTTDTAEDFYLRRGYVKDPAIQAKNHDDVYVKNLYR